MRVFHKGNEGVAAARQYGIDHASGEYMIHVDPDDWIEKDAIELLVDAAEKNGASVVVCDYNQITSNSIIPKPQILDGSESNSLINGILSGTLLGGVCNKLISRDLYLSAQFLPGIDYCEDVLYLAAICSKEKFKLSRVDKALYNYDKSTGKTITSGKFTKEKFKAYRAFQRQLQIYCPNLTFQQITNSVADVALKTFLNDTLSSAEFYHEFKSQRKYLKAMRAPKKLKFMIVASSYGLYFLCQSFFRLYSKVRN